LYTGTLQERWYSDIMPIRTPLIPAPIANFHTQLDDIDARSGCVSMPLSIDSWRQDEIAKGEAS
jgi:hypothetical protein